LRTSAYFNKLAAPSEKDDPGKDDHR